MRNIYFEPAGNILSSHRSIFQNPPEEYRFVVRNDKFGKVSHNLLNSELYKFGIAKLPFHIIKPCVEKFTVKRPDNCFLTFSWNHLIFRDESWIAQVEWPEMLAGFNYYCYKTFKKLIERKLSEDNCKAIITWSNISKASFYNNFECKGFIDKVSVVPLAVRPQEFIPKQRDNDFVTFLFVSSPMRGREDYNFHMKGGKETLEAFDIVSKKHKEARLIMISEVPKEYGRFKSMQNVKIMNNTLEPNEVSKEYRKSDIFLFPGHDTPFGVILEAMSFGLPVIATDVYGNKELVTNNFDGYTIPSSKKVKYFRGTLATRPLTGPNNIPKDILNIDKNIVEALVDKMIFLVEHSDVRNKIGDNAKYTIDKGVHSIANRNKVLKKIFDGIK